MHDRLESKLMKIDKFTLAGLCIFGAMRLAVCAQGTSGGGQVQIPNSATVTAGPPKALRPGEEFLALLQFDKPPMGYGEGIIKYYFDRITPPSPPAFSRSYQAIQSFEGQIVMKDGQAIYKIEVPISKSMESGTWKLSRVTFGVAAQKQLTISNDIAFELQQPPPGFRVEASPEVNAGQRYVVKVILDQYPKGVLAEKCTIQFSGTLAPAGPAEPGQWIQMRTDQKTASPDTHVYELSSQLAPDLPSGVWHVDISESASPRHFTDRKTYRGDFAFCDSSDEIAGTFHIRFSVKPAPNLTTPTSVSITVNPSQVQLFLSEADRLKAEEEHVKAQLASRDALANRTVIQNALKAALDDLDATEVKFKEKQIDSSLSANAVNVFFDDIRFEYADDLRILAHEVAYQPVSNSPLRYISAPASLSAVSNAVLKSMARTESLYRLVAASGTLSFDLYVNSVPDQALISYRQRIDKDFTFVDHPTDYRIENLTIGKYLIRVQKAGNKDACAWYDPVTDSNSSIEIHMGKQPCPVK